MRDLRLDYQLHLPGGETEWVEPPKHLHLQADLLVQEWNGALNNKNTNSCDIPSLKHQKTTRDPGSPKLRMVSWKLFIPYVLFQWWYSHPNHHPLTFGEPGSVKSNSWIPVPWWVQCPLNSWVSSTLPSTLIASFYYTNYSNYPGVFSNGGSLIIVPTETTKTKIFIDGKIFKQKNTILWFLPPPKNGTSTRLYIYPVDTKPPWVSFFNTSGCLEKPTNLPTTLPPRPTSVRSTSTTLRSKKPPPRPKPCKARASANGWGKLRWENGGNDAGLTLVENGEVIFVGARCFFLVGGWTKPFEKYAQVKLDHLSR